jgi:glycosyltransferase involved in cell wall biosynthesis
LIQEGKNGITINTGDADAFIAAAKALAGDNDSRRRLGAQASRSMQDHGWAAVVERFEAVLREVSQ